MNEYKKIAKYQLIENDLLDLIKIGTYEKEPFPSENALALKYHCSRVTVRQALSNLAYKGIIKRTQGSGSVVQKSNVIQRTPLLKSFSDDILEQGKFPHSDVLTFNITTAGQTISDLLGINEHDRIYYIERLRYADDTPVLFEKTFMAVNLHPEMSIKVLHGSKYKYADEQGLNIDYAYQSISPIFAPDYIAHELRISDNQPILKIQNTTYLVDGRVFDTTELYFNTDYYQLNIIKKR